MADLIDDTYGQWIALSGLTISLSLIVVAVLINQATITGYYSSHAAIEFPKNQIRELATETQINAKIAAQIAWTLNNSNNETVLTNFSAIISNYSSQVNTIYAVHGQTVNVTLFNYYRTEDVFGYSSNIPIFNSTNHTIDRIWLNISYDDGTTRYALEPELIEMK